jgi:hypothetical protein
MLDHQLLLCVGGPLDGKELTVRKNQRAIQTPVQLGETFTYVRIELNTPSGKVFILAPPGVSPRSVLQTLITSYRRRSDA